MVRYYTPINKDDFEKSTCIKKEFRKYTWEKDTALIKGQLFPHQQWLANYIGNKTPYKGILVYHETGTGKTCTAISIAENFRDELVKYNKKITILSSSTIAEEFYRTIANLDPDAVKCTGNIYNDMVQGPLNAKTLKSKINEFYNFRTHQTFGSAIMKEIQNLDDAGKKHYINTKFSNEVILVDEAQHLRAKSDLKFQKDIKNSHEAIDLISKYADNVRIIFLTATPMYDNPTEIIWLINVLIRVNKDTWPELEALKAQGKDGLCEDDIFDKKNGYAFKSDEAKKLFIRAIRGKVSFLRGGNPERFPLKLYDNLNESLPDTNFMGGPVAPALKKLETRLTLSTMSKDHYADIKALQEIKNIKEEKDSFHMQMIQMHNVRWYKKSSTSKNTLEDDSSEFGGLSKYFDIDIKGNNTVYFTPNSSSPNVLKNLSEYAPKINTIMRHINEMTTGIAFVFSQFVNSGIIPMMLALESYGYTKYDGENSDLRHLKGMGNATSKGKYMTITSNKLVSNPTLLNEYLKVARGKGNENGEKIKVIIASGTGSEGIDLKWIRQVHIMEPHFHFSQIEQAVGRAIRSNSHAELNLTDRNCTIYYHASKYPDDIDKETVDIYLYRIAMSKRSATQNVRKLIQKNSITCKFFKEANEFSYDAFLGKTIKDSKGNEFIYTEDMILDDGYTNTCATCKDDSVIDIDTYDPSTHSRWDVYACITRIIQIFYVNDKYSLKDIMASCKKLSPLFDNETIYKAIDIIVNTARTITNQFGISGIVIQDSLYYKFLPEHAEYTGYLTGLPLSLANVNVPLSKIPWPERPMAIQGNSNIIKEFEVISSKSLFNDSIWTQYSDIKDDIMAEILIDKLPSYERLSLYNKMPLEIQSLNKALSRYSQDGRSYLDIKSITTTPHIKLIWPKDNAEVIREHPPKQNNKTTMKRPIIGYIDIWDGKGVAMIRDVRKKKASGQNISTLKKTEAQEIVNHICQLKASPGSKAFLDYPRYVANPEKTGQINAALPKKGDYTVQDVVLEIEALLRLYEKLRSNKELKWFLNSWETYDYGIKSKDKTNIKAKGKTVLKK